MICPVYCNVRQRQFVYWWNATFSDWPTRLHLALILIYDYMGSTERVDGLVEQLTDGCDIPKLSSLRSWIFPVVKYRSVAKHFNSGVIGLFRLVGDVIVSFTNSTTTSIPSQSIQYRFNNSLSFSVSKTFSHWLTAGILGLFVTRS